MKFSLLSVYLERLEKTSSRIEITKILAELLAKSDPETVDKICYLVLGYLRPKYEGLVFNLAEKKVVEAISQGFAEEKAAVLADFRKKGDLGDVAYDLALKKGVKVKAPTVEVVYERLFEIAQDEGEGSQERKVKSLAELLTQLDALSAKFVTRIVLGKLRLGFSDKTILDALSWFETGDKSQKPILEKAYAVLPDVGRLAAVVKKGGGKATFEDISPVVGVPVLPMLAQRLRKPAEMIAKMGEVGVEPKIDGLRIQIHFKRGENGFAKAFTRNLNEVSWMFPELLAAGEFIKAREVILDSEAVGVDETRKKMADFQTTMTRRRKHKIESFAAVTPIRFFVFDILLVDGENLMPKPYLERKERLFRTVKEGKIFKPVPHQLAKQGKEIRRVYEESIKKGFEGVVVKKISSGYIPGRTGWHWVKMKQSEGEEGKLADTIDGVIMGYYLGKGKRTQFGLGGFLVGIIDKGQVKSLTKLGTGLTDAEFGLLKSKLKGLESSQKPVEYAEIDKALKPDFWVRPSLVVEIAADEITKSPIHTSGYALRFPRLIRLREDKDFLQATSLEEIKSLFKLQRS